MPTAVADDTVPATEDDAYEAGPGAGPAAAYAAVYAAGVIGDAAADVPAAEVVGPATVRVRNVNPANKSGMVESSLGAGDKTPAAVGGVAGMEEAAEVAVDAVEPVAAPVPDELAGGAACVVGFGPGVAATEGAAAVRAGTRTVDAKKSAMLGGAAGDDTATDADAGAVVVEDADVDMDAEEPAAAAGLVAPDNPAISAVAAARVGAIVAPGEETWRGGARNNANGSACAGGFATGAADRADETAGATEDDRTAGDDPAADAAPPVVGGAFVAKSWDRVANRSGGDEPAVTVDDAADEETAPVADEVPADDDPAPPGAPPSRWIGAPAAGSGAATWMCARSCLAPPAAAPASTLSAGNGRAGASASVAASVLCPTVGRTGRVL